MDLQNPAIFAKWQRSVLASAIGLTFLALSHGQAAAQAPLSDCDRLAANPTDARKHPSAPGVQFKEVRERVTAALQACQAAMKQYPDELRFKYQYARVLQIQDKRQAYRLFIQLVNANYPAAYDNFGWLQISEERDFEGAIRAFRQGYELGDADCAVIDVVC